MPFRSSKDSAQKTRPKRGVVLVLILMAVLAQLSQAADAAPPPDSSGIGAWPKMFIKWLAARFNLIGPEFYSELEEMRTDLNNLLGLNFLTTALEKAKGLYSEALKLLQDLWSWARSLFTP